MNMTSQASNMSGPLSHSSPYYITPGKYQENGDTLSDFVNLVCQEAQNSGPSPQVCITLCFSNGEIVFL